MEAFKQVFDWLKSSFELWWWTLVALVTIAFVVRQCWHSYFFLRRLHAGTARGSFGRILLLLVHVAVQRPGSLLSREQPFLKFVRIRAEHEIFDPRPIWKWPLPDDDAMYGRGDHALDMRGKDRGKRRDTHKSARKAAISRFRAQLRNWRGRMHDVLNDPDPESKDKTLTVISIDHAGQLNDELSTIKRYFDTLKTMTVRHGGELKFFCAVDVKIGFVASQHLIAGLLVKYNQNWGKVIDGFERDTNSNDKGALGTPRDIRQIQSFIYHCWLLWGPSIPVCAHSCEAWDADFATLQFGYGDENNAIEIVGETGFLREQVEAHIARMGKRARNAMALPAGVTGRLQYSSIIELDRRRIPPALRHSWSGPETERPVLFLSREGTGSEVGEKEYPPVGNIRREDHGSEDGPGRSRYYSAYLWIMFVVLRPHKGGWRPIHYQPGEEGFADGSGEPWKGTLPFFEHGNMADPETCAFTKQQLAMKTVSGLAQMIRMAGDGEIKFAYACAIDDANCSQPLAFPELAGGKLMRDLVLETIERQRKIDPDFDKIADQIDFKTYAPDAEEGPWNPHSACHQTDWVRKHYTDLDESFPQAAE